MLRWPDERVDGTAGPQEGADARRHRRRGRLPKDQKAGEAQKAIAAAAAPRQRRRLASEERGAASTVNGVNTADDASASGSASASTVNAVNTPLAQDTESSQQGQAEQPRRLPYGDAFSVVAHLHLKMEPAAFAQGARVWLTILREKQPEAYSVLLRELAEQEKQPV